MNGKSVDLLRRELQQASMDWGVEDKPSQSADIFFPVAHIKALALDRPLVIGMRGAGKSFWSEVLTNPDLRPNLAKFVKAYQTLDSVCDIRWDKDGLFSTKLPESSVLTVAMENGLEPRLLWLGLILNGLRKQCQSRNIPVKMPESSMGWATILRWVRENPDLVRSSFEQLNNSLAKDGKVILVVLDALDRMAAQLSQGLECLRGLLALLLDARQLKGLRFKVFLRDDMSHMPSVLAFPDASKLINEAVYLKWSREDIYALHLHKLAQKSPRLQQLIEHDFGPAESTNNGYWHGRLMYSPTEADLTALLGKLAPQYMGKNARKGRVYSWWHKHLADGKLQVSPRTFAASLKEALNLEQKAGLAHVLLPQEIHQGVLKASEARVKELKEDYFWVPVALAAFNDRTTPIAVRDIYNIWNGKGIEGEPAPKKIREMCSQEKVFLPWDNSDILTSPSQKLRDTLVGLGVLVLRDKDTRLDMPDIYRLGYRIRKKGGVSPRRS